MENPVNTLSHIEREPIGYTRIQPPKGWQPVDLLDLWNHRSLLYNLVWRDLKVRYVNTGLGMLWAVIQPLALSLIMAFVLGLFVRFETKTLYSLVVISGLAVWFYFSNAITNACGSVIANFPLFSKVFLPRLLIPMVSVIVELVNFAILLLVLIALSLAQGVLPLLSWLLLPVPIFVLIGLTLGVSLWLSSLNVPYRDISKALPVIIQIGFYASPIFYPLSAVPYPWYWLSIFNPITGIVSSIRWVMFQEGDFPWLPLLISAVYALVLVISGAFIFRRIEDRFVDIA